MNKRIIALAVVLLMMAAILPFTATPAMAASSYSYVEIIPLKYEEASGFSEGLAAVRQNGKWGFIGVTGKEIIPLKYDNVKYGYGAFSEGLAAVCLNGKWGFIDTTGKEVVPLRYDMVEMFSEGLACVMRDGKWGVVDKAGREVVSPKYGVMQSYQGGLALVGPHWECLGFINKNGNEVIPIKYTNRSEINNRLVSEEGIVALELDGKWGFVDINGNEVLPFIYEGARLFSEGLAGVKLNGKWGFISIAGDVVLPFVYDDAHSFSEGLVGVKLDGGWGFINKDGTIAVSAKYGRVVLFQNGLAIVAVGIKHGLIDKSGKEIIEPKYDWVFPYSNGHVGVMLDNKGGVFDTTGKEIVPYGKYDWIHNYSEDILRVSRSEFDSNGKWLGTKYGFIEFIKIIEAPNLNTAATWAHDGITSAVNKGFVPADLQGNYSNIITRQEFCRMAIKFVEYKTGKSIEAVLSERGQSRNSNAFTDTNDSDILAAFALGITNGTGPNTFNPDGQFSREQAATMIRNVCKVLDMDVTNPSDQGFTDISSASTWAIDGINFCRANGIMNGTNTTPLTFSPKSTYTRQESILTFNNIK